VTPEFHDEFVALCALFYAGEISEEEWALLQIHMGYCDSCHARFLDCQRLASDVIPALAVAAASELDEPPKESTRMLQEAEERLMRRLDASHAPDPKSGPSGRLSWRISTALLAACALMTACLAALHFFRAEPQPLRQAKHQPPMESGSQSSLAPSAGSGTRVADSQEEMSDLHKQLADEEDRLGQSHADIADLERQLEAEKTARQQLAEQQEDLSGQLAAAHAEAESLRSRLTSATADTGQQSASLSDLEAKVHELNATLEKNEIALAEKNRILDLDKDFLDHDRDIRNVIGARNLYIADISDTSEDGKTAKQFGRIFYTKDRSLIFYGFDLDSQAGNRQNVSFQVWGSATDRPAPVSLGLFFEDDGHKRWVLRCNDEKALARLNMVFVTVEPPGGSSRPTGKQLLRAYLQIPANHP
jgi:hypothetical protein